ncbi:PREDICTED: transcription repressor OFP6-like [Brassica oleracea var. oleracea]|uniref:Transcription repressor n=2 Tax=Brassica oleracea TaxID=3712 RepID=A0A0D3BRP0_BRAOL|nr:PREDICTED: transcription repressor OFP6-like [Brassica oleracea var. oleracea]VDD06127.1 unnamed protein product [Brassica oleracea]
MAVKSKKKMVLKAVSVVNIGCSNCKFPTLSSFFNRSSKKPSLYSSSYGHGHGHGHSSSTTTTTVSSSSAIPSTTHWFSDNTSSSSAATPSAAVAVEKDSDDPYLDFRQSMLQMILENEIYSKDDLRELLNCFLSLNEPYHHSIIIRAFSEIWEGVFSAAVKRRGSVQESPLVRHHGPSRASRDYHNHHYH